MLYFPAFLVLCYTHSNSSYEISNYANVSSRWCFSMHRKQLTPQGAIRGNAISSLNYHQSWSLCIFKDQNGRNFNCLPHVIFSIMRRMHNEVDLTQCYVDIKHCFIFILNLSLDIRSRLFFLQKDILFLHIHLFTLVKCI